ncbi:MAG: proline-rich domain-containing protein [Caldilineaceae bacterium]|nr:proline-rich domain-containing protein [Caldilineaceae bacterium]MDE0337924.1 proline-rich domain-containing protein [Caldilineaceae bacterium]
MNASPRRNRKMRITGTFLLALLLTITLLPAAALAGPPPADDDGSSNTGQNQQQTPLPGGGQGTPLPGANQGPPVPGANTGTPLPDANQGPPVPGANTGTPLPDGNQQTSDPHPDAPDYPSADCIVSHAATPAQLCPIAGGLQYYFIGADGSTSIGPFISSFTDLASLYTTGEVLLYSGVNPLTSKSVQVHYLTSSYEIRVSTYYPDNEYDTDKPYTFTVNGSNVVSHIAW